jgi:hypothetical protein
MGPAAFRCPARILDRLTPTDVEYAQDWRDANRARLDRPKVKPGARVRFARPLTFTNGDAGDLFELVQRSTFRRVDESGYVYSTLYRLGAWRELAYTVEG